MLKGDIMRLKSLVQIGVVFLICIIGELISKLLPFAFPGSVIAMLVLFVLLFFGILKTEHIKDKTDFMLNNMAFFFIPSSVGIINYYSDIKSVIIPFVFICIITTLITFLATAYTVKAVMKLQRMIKESRGKE